MVHFLHRATCFVLTILAANDQSHDADYFMLLISYSSSCLALVFDLWFFLQQSFYNSTVQRVGTMSLVRSVEPATASFRNTKLYSIQDSSDSTGMAIRMFGSDKHKPVYVTDSYSSESYEKYFLDSPTNELIHSSSSGISGSLGRLQDVSSCQIRGSSLLSLTDLKPLQSSISLIECSNIVQSIFF